MGVEILTSFFPKCEQNQASFATRLTLSNICRMLGDVCTPGKLPMSQTKGFSIITESRRGKSSTLTHWRNANDLQDTVNVHQTLGSNQLCTNNQQITQENGKQRCMCLLLNISCKHLHIWNYHRKLILCGLCSVQGKKY